MGLGAPGTPGSPTWGLEEAGGPHSHSGAWGDPAPTVLGCGGDGGPRGHSPGLEGAGCTPVPPPRGSEGTGGTVALPDGSAEGRDTDPCPWGWRRLGLVPGLWGWCWDPDLSPGLGTVRPARAQGAPGPAGGGAAAPGTGHPPGGAQRDRATPGHQTRSPPGDHSRSGAPGPPPVLQPSMSHPVSPAAAPGALPPPAVTPGDPDPPYPGLAAAPSSGHWGRLFGLV